MIAPSAVQTFLNRRLRDSAKYKAMSRKEIKRRLRKYVPKNYKYPLRPRDHDLTCLYVGHRYSRWLFALGLGAGKSSLSLHLLQQRRKDFRRALILVPNRSNIGGWIDQAKLHTPKFKVTGLTGTRLEREAVFVGKSDALSLTYMGFLSFVCTRKITGYKTFKGKRTPVRKMVVDPKRIKFLLKHFDAIVLDEVTACKNHQSMTFKALRLIAKHMKLCYGLTGTPFGRDLQDLWAQLLVIDGGETFGPTLGLYRASFFNQKAAYRGFTYTVNKRKKPLLKKMLRNRCIRYKESEYRKDMPPVTRTVVPCEFSAKAEKIYDDLAKQLHAQRKDQRLVEQSFIRMRQLCGGFVVMESEVDGQEQRIEVPLAENPKMDAMIQKISELPEGAKFLIFNQFKMTGELISNRLTKEKIKHIKLAGGCKDPAELVRQFTNDPSISGMILSSAGALGLNLQAAQYVFFFESPTDPITRLQMEKRADRVGQTKPIYQFDFIIKGSPDESILKHTEEARDLIAEILDGEGEAAFEKQPSYLQKVMSGEIDLRRKAV